MEKISVLLSIYINSRLDHFIECMDSINNQTLIPDEIIIIQDGAISFNLDLFLLKYKKLNFLIVKNKINLGLPLSLNKGLKKCNNEIVFRIDSDDICLPNRFELQLQRFLKNENLVVLGCNAMLIDNNSVRINSERIMPQGNLKIKKIMPYKNPINHPSVVYKKSAVLFVGGYSNVYLYEDWYLWFKLSLLKNVEFENMSDKLIKYRIRTFNDRKGFKIVRSEFKFYKLLLKQGYIKRHVFYLNITIKFLVRLMPGFFYKFFKHNFDKLS